MKGSFERIGLSPKVLSYSSASTSTLNVVRVQVQPGITIRGREGSELVDYGYLRLTRLAVADRRLVAQLGAARVDLLPNGFFLGEQWDGECIQFQIHVGLPIGTSCRHVAFSLGMWNPPASVALQGLALLLAVVRYPLVVDLLWVSSSNLALGSETTVTLHFVLSVPAEIVRWAFDVRSSASCLVASITRLAASIISIRRVANAVATSAAATGAAASWALWDQVEPEPVQMGATSNEMLLVLGGSGLLPLVTYGFSASLAHPAGSEEELDVVEEVRLGSVSPGTKAGYSLRQLRDCSVLPWDNRIQQRSPVLLRFTSTMAMDVLGGIPVLVITPPLAFRFDRECFARPPRPAPSDGGAEVLPRKLLLVSSCRRQLASTWQITELKQELMEKFEELKAPHA
ncbi:hypothetical protein AK812_SmicGene29628 [Symbiodinium microadriaticum]|uniref:Uncharacterized protein n=1 Tax=Symbiodinium microadriaticum TaxID=2951 RepID=A0A1Q9D1A9_SYMMI|nr:hypothetical protein AK812_SmicGene29628 [Symbiodinium microadriaticum]